MSSLFDKINTLVNAQVNDLLGRNPRSPLARIKLNAEDAEKNPRRSVQSLRQRLEEAIDYEDELQAKVESLMREVADLDEQVDRVLRAGDEFGARRLQNQLNLKGQQLTIAESELRDHRLLTQHLMQEMTTVEMALDGQERRANTRARSAAGGVGSGRKRIHVQDARDGAEPDNQGSSIIGAVTGKLDEARSSLENLLNNSPVPKPSQITGHYERFDVVVDEEPDPRKPKPRKSDKPNMDARLSRLSKPEDDTDSA